MKLTNNDQKISLITSHYFFFLLKLLVEKHKKLSDPEIYLMIIKNSAESINIKGNMQHFTELLEKIFANQKNLTGQHDFMSALVSILGNMIKNKNDLDSIKESILTMEESKKIFEKDFFSKFEKYVKYLLLQKEKEKNELMHLLDIKMKLDLEIKKYNSKIAKQKEKKEQYENYKK